MNTRARPKQMLSSHKPGAQPLTDRSQNSHVYFSEVNLALLSFFWPDSCVGLTKGPHSQSLNGKWKPNAACTRWTTRWLARSSQKKTFKGRAPCIWSSAMTWHPLEPSTFGREASWPDEFTIASAACFSKFKMPMDVEKHFKLTEGTWSQCIHP